MRVAINAQLVSFEQSYRNAGVSRYTYMLLEGLSQLATGQDDTQNYVAFVNAAEVQAASAGPLAQSSRLELVPARWQTPTPARRVAWEQLTLPGELRRRRIDVFHSPVNVLPERLPCASVVTIHDLAFVRYPQYFRPSRRYYQQWFTSRSARHATRIVADSESTKRDLIEHMRAPEQHIHVIYPGVDDDFRPVEDANERAAFRERHGLPERYILYLGTIEPRKNVTGLLDAYARLRTLYDDTPPLVVAGGKGWYYDAVFARVKVLNLEPVVTFPGYISRTEQALWYSCADLFVYPSLYEGFGLPIVEAMACGTPAITSNVSSMPEAAGPAALQTDPTDYDGLAHAMRDVLCDTELRARMRSDGLAWAARFTQERMAQAYTDVYASAYRAAGETANWQRR